MPLKDYNKKRYFKNSPEPTGDTAKGATAGSVIGGIAETQELLDFCGEHNIVSEI